VNIGRRVRQGCCLSLIVINLQSEYLTTEDREGFSDFKIGGQTVCIVKYTDNLVLLAKEEMLLQGTIENVIDVRRFSGLEMNLGMKTVVMRISRQPSIIRIMTDQKQSENVKCFKYLGSMITNDAR
jgi:hypothetical protein